MIPSRKPIHIFGNGFASEASRTRAESSAMGFFPLSRIKRFDVYSAHCYALSNFAIKSVKTLSIVIVCEARGRVVAIIESTRW